MAQKTSKTLELRIKTVTDGDSALAEIRKQVKGLGVTVTDLTSEYKQNEEGIVSWSHRVQLATKDAEKLEKVKAKLATSSIGGNLEQVSIFQKPLKEEQALAKERARLEKERLRRNTQTNKELLAANNRALKLEKLSIEKGAHDIATIREKLAQKERNIAIKLQKDLAKIAEAGAKGKLKNVPAARAKAFAQYRKDVTKVYKELNKANKADALAQSQKIARNKEIVSDLKRIEGAQSRINEKIRGATRAHRHWSVAVAEGIGLYRVVSSLLTGISEAIRSIPKVGIDLQTSQAVLEATLGSATAAAGAFKALDQEAIRTGISISTIRENFRNLNASMTLAGETTQTVFKVFSDLNTVSTALHLSGEKTQLVFLAIAQIFNKSKVQSEELVKQLGNLLPGAFASFRAANYKMFKDTQDLIKKMSDGSVFAHKTVKEFTDYMANKFKDAFAIAQTGVQANIGRMQTSFTHLGEAIFRVVDGPLVDFIQTVTKATDALTGFVEKTSALSVLFKGAIIVGASLLGAKLLKLSRRLFIAKKDFGMMAGGIRKVTGASAFLRNSLNALKVAFAFFARTPVGILILVGIAAEAFASIGRDADLAAQKIRNFIKERDKLDNINQINLEFRIKNNPRIQSVDENIAVLQKRIELNRSFFGRLSSIITTGNIKASQRQQVEDKKLIKAAFRAREALVTKEKLKQAKFEKEQKIRERQLEESLRSQDINGTVKHATALARLKAVKDKEELFALQSKLSKKASYIEAFYKKKEEIEKRAAVSQANIDVLNLSKKPVKEELLARQKELDLELKQIAIRNEKEKQQALQALRKPKKIGNNSEKARQIREEQQAQQAAIQTEITLLKLKGQVFEATRKEQLLKKAGTLSKLTGDSVEVKNARKQLDLIEKIKVTQSLVNYQSEAQQKLTGKLAAQEEVISAKEQAGILTRTQAFDLLQQKRQETLTALQNSITVMDDLVAAQERLNDAGANPILVERLKEAKRQAALLGLQIKGAARQSRREINVLGTDIRGGLQSSLANSFASFISGAKSATAAMRDFAVSILDQIRQIAAQKLAMQIINLALSAFGSSSGGKGSTVDGALAKSSAFSSFGKGISSFQKDGGVNTGMAAASGTILDSATYFPNARPTMFASGGVVAGEAGSEAVLPLKRNSTGKLGVVAQLDSTKLQGNTYNINVTVTKGKNESSVDTGNKIAIATMKKIAQQEIATANRPGNQSNKITAFG